MNEFKNLIGNTVFDRTDLLEKIGKLETDNEKNTSVINCLESQVRSMHRRETMAKRKSLSTALASKSCMTTVAKPSAQNEEVEKLKSQLAAKNEEIAKLNKTIHKMVDCFREQLNERESKIRELNNTVVDLKGQIRVAVRVRDTVDPQGLAAIGKNDIKLEQNGQCINYQFEHVFKSGFCQKMVFEEIQELILCTLHGCNVCLIAYGPTGSGKTYTMRGGDSLELEGVIPRSVRYLLENASGTMAVAGWQFRFSASFMEVYNEEVFDLLDGRKKCEVKLNGIDGSPLTTITGIKKLPITSIDDINLIISHADTHRSTASTACNSLSSRSHAIFQIHVEGINSTTGENIKCCLNLVDLAGSERAKESGAQGERFNELKNINQSLSTLKKCIRAQKMQMSHVPYRESKLTILLRAYLGAGSSKTMFIAHLSPKDINETKRTLDFTADLRSTNVGRAVVQRG